MQQDEPDASVLGKCRCTGKWNYIQWTVMMLRRLLGADPCPRVVDGLNYAQLPGSRQSVREGIHVEAGEILHVMALFSLEVAGMSQVDIDINIDIQISILTIDIHSTFKDIAEDRW
jgi:hypothetical protein